MATHLYSTLCLADPATLMLAKLFPTWDGKAAEPRLPPPGLRRPDGSSAGVLVAPRPNRPAPAARELVEA